MFKAKATLVKMTQCPLCHHKINVGPGETEFRDELSVKEYQISGMCQKCQDYMFGTD